MIRMINNFKSIDTSDSLLFEVFVEMMKLGVYSGNVFWVESNGTKEKMSAILSGVKLDDLKSYNAIISALEDFGFGLTTRHTDEYISIKLSHWYCRPILNSPIFTDDLQRYYQKMLKSSKIISFCHDDISTACLDILKYFVIPYLQDNGKPTEDLVLVCTQRRLIESPRENIYEKFNISLQEVH